MCLLRPENGLPAGGSPLGAHAYLAKHLRHTIAGLKIVIHNQGTQSLQLHGVLFFTHHIRKRKIKAHSKGSALAQLTLHFNSTAHHIHSVLGDGHAKARALDAAHSGTLFALEGIKDMLQKILAHTDAAIADYEIIMGMARLFGCFLANREGYHAPDGSELSGIAQNIDEHLIQTQRVENQLLVLHIDGVHIKLHALGSHLRTNHIHQIVNTLAKITFLFLNDNLAAFDAAHIQNIINEAQQMIAGAHDFF